jgi:hypothetical protein
MVNSHRHRALGRTEYVHGAILERRRKPRRKEGSHEKFREGF